MRLWTLHPKYLDALGLVALWRESLLAQRVLMGRTVGYRSHPQLIRFKMQPEPVAAVALYLDEVYQESLRRGYQFCVDKIAAPRSTTCIDATMGQLLYEWAHLRAKLLQRAPAVAERWTDVSVPDPHPLFRVIPGGVEPWERVTTGILDQP
jgi:hypothetical protein